MVELAVGNEQKLYFCYDSSDPVGPSMIPIKTIVIEKVRGDISSVKQAYVKLACNRVISPGITHIACESASSPSKVSSYLPFTIATLGRTRW